MKSRSRESPKRVIQQKNARQSTSNNKEPGSHDSLRDLDPYENDKRRMKEWHQMLSSFNTSLRSWATPQRDPSNKEGKIERRYQKLGGERAIRSLQTGRNMCITGAVSDDFGNQPSCAVDRKPASEESVRQSAIISCSTIVNGERIALEPSTITETKPGGSVHIQDPPLEQRTYRVRTSDVISQGREDFILIKGKKPCNDDASKLCPFLQGESELSVSTVMLERTAPDALDDSEGAPMLDDPNLNEFIESTCTATVHYSSGHCLPHALETTFLQLGMQIANDVFSVVNQVSDEVGRKTSTSSTRSRLFSICCGRRRK